MSRALTISGLVVSGLLGLLFTADLAVGIPFGTESKVMDIAILFCAVVLGYLGWSTLREGT